LPKEKILFTGDACVNGPFNFVGDGDIRQWIETLEAAKKLQPRIVAPGHGPIGDATMLQDQQDFFRALLAHAKKLNDTKATKEQITSQLDAIKEEMKKNSRIARYVGDGLRSQLDKALVELGGSGFLTHAEREDETHHHQHAHGHSHEHGPATVKPLIGAP
jgi:hypothetical protein